MSGNFLALAQPGVQQLSPYVPGKPVDELARELNLDPAKIVKLASNENPLGPSPKVLAAIREELGRADPLSGWQRFCPQVPAGAEVRGRAESGDPGQRLQRHS